MSAQDDRIPDRAARAIHAIVAWIVDGAPSRAALDSALVINRLPLRLLEASRPDLYADLRRRTTARRAAIASGTSQPANPAGAECPGRGHSQPVRAAPVQGVLL